MTPTGWSKCGATCAVDSGKPSLGNPDKAFIAFCRKRYERNLNP